jgi:hypothetical protein
MEDWRYENLTQEVKRLREDLYEVRGRTNKVESWQSLFPLNVLIAVMWLIAAGMAVFSVVAAASS